MGSGTFLAGFATDLHFAPCFLRLSADPPAGAQVGVARDDALLAVFPLIADKLMLGIMVGLDQKGWFCW